MSRRRPLETGSGDAGVRKVLVAAALIAFVPIVIFAPRGGDPGPASGVRPSPRPVASPEAVEEAARFPLRTGPHSSAQEVEPESTLLPEQGVDRAASGRPGL